MTTKKTKKKTPEKSTKKVAKRNAVRRRPGWANRKTSVAAVSKPEEVTVPEGFKLHSVQPLGVLGTKIWLEVTVVPER